jgi:hypothetical protein
MTAPRLAAIALLLCVVPLRAQIGQRPRETRIDPLTASIGGRVTTQNGAPIRRAEVRAVSDVGLTRLATTDSEGRYVVRDLPAGNFTLHVSKSGFVPLYFGQRRPFERRTTIRLAEGQRADADVRLPRAGAITGRVVDSAGEPVLGVRVQALRRRMVDGVRGLQAVGTGDTTDDTGAYRVYGLPPGDYYVTATARSIENRAGRPLLPSGVSTRGTPIYYPGTANRDEAQRITVEVSGEARADLQLVDLRTSRVSGIVLTANGTPAAGAMVTLSARDLDIGGTAADGVSAPMQILDDAAEDGTFELTGVPPGSFMLRVQSRPNVSAAFDPVNQRVINPNFRPVLETAVVPVTVDGDIGGLTLVTSPGGSVDVSIVADQGTTAALPNGVRVTFRSVDSRSESMTMNSGVTTAKVSVGITAPTRVTVEGLPDNWAVKAIMLDNDDVTDRLIDLKNRPQASVRVVLTDRVTDVVGAISAASFGDASSNEGTVIVFANDPAKWSPPSRFVRIARTTEKGVFQLTGLPPEEYLAVAVDYLEDGEETDPDFLKRMRERATRFSLREGERRAIDLRLIQR